MHGTFAKALDNAARLCIVALGFSIPISTALDQVVCGFVLLAWLVGGNYREKLLRIRDNPVALAALVFVFIAVVAVAWSQGPVADRLTYLRKYSNALFIPVFVYFCADGRMVRRALIAFATALALTLIVSFAAAWDWIPTGGLIKGTSEHPVIKSRITQNILMSYGSLLFIVLAGEAKSGAARWAWRGLALAAALNVLLITPGRIGYILLPALCLLYFHSRFQWKGLLAGGALVGLTLVSAYFVSETFHDRVASAVMEVTHWNRETPATKSIEYRLEFYTNTLTIIEQRPWLGVGTGGFKHSYAETVRASTMTPTSNPHSMYLLTAAEFGMVGLAALVVLLVVEWRMAARAMTPAHVLLARALVVTIALAGLFNSIIIDHTESLFFAWMSALLFAGFSAIRRGVRA